MGPRHRQHEVRPERALTIGTLDGANVEIKEQVGDDNIVIFGRTAAEVADRRSERHDPARGDRGSPELARPCRRSSGVFSPDDPGRYGGLIGGLYDHDWFAVAADSTPMPPPSATSTRSGANPVDSGGKAILNTARMGWFSSDRTIREYAGDIWGVRL